MGSKTFFCVHCDKLVETELEKKKILGLETRVRRCKECKNVTIHYLDLPLAIVLRIFHKVPSDMQVGLLHKYGKAKLGLGKRYTIKRKGE